MCVVISLPAVRHNCWMTQPMQKIVAWRYVHVTVVPSVEPVPGGGNWRIVLTHSHSLSLSSTPDHHVTDFSSSYFILYLLLYAYLHAAVGCAADLRTHTALALLTEIPFIPLFIQSQECQESLKKKWKIALKIWICMSMIWTELVRNLNISTSIIQNNISHAILLLLRFLLFLDTGWIVDSKFSMIFGDLKRIRFKTTTVRTYLTHSGAYA